MNLGGFFFTIPTCKGEPWFAAADVCKPLGITPTGQASALSKCSSTVVRDHRINGGWRGRPNKMVTEAGVYEQFGQWVKGNLPLTERHEQDVTRPAPSPWPYGAP